MERSKDRIHNGYRDYNPRMQREDAGTGRYQNSFEGEDVYSEIMQAGRNQTDMYQNDYTASRRQNYDQSFEGYDDYDMRQRSQRDQRDPLQYDRSQRDPYYQRDMSGVQDPYSYGNSFPNESIGSLLKDDFQQPASSTRPSYEQTPQYHTGQFYNSPQEAPLRRGRMEPTDDPFGNQQQQTGSFSFDSANAPRQRLKRQPDYRENPMPMQNVQGVPYAEEAIPNNAVRSPRKASLTLSEEYEMSRKQKKKKEKVPKEKKEKKKKMPKAVSATPHMDGSSYKQFGKWNLLIFLVAFINITIITLITASLVYSTYFKNFALQSDIVKNIVTYCIIISVLFAYNTAGIHCGYTIFKDKLANLNVALKVLLFPIILIFIEIIGFISEIPYLIYSFVKAGDSK